MLLMVSEESCNCTLEHYYTAASPIPHRMNRQCIRLGFPQIRIWIPNPRTPPEVPCRHNALNVDIAEAEVGGRGTRWYRVASGHLSGPLVSPFPLVHQS